MFVNARVECKAGGNNGAVAVIPKASLIAHVTESAVVLNSDHPAQLNVLNIALLKLNNCNASNF